ncbi:DUF2393 family protein [Campylobacter taeniopygiae]|uniref:DUF2393 family protein n=1 Tax=Campylobacter taeniopygiae TaxID=2510188 RepID=UPI003D6BE348
MQLTFYHLLTFIIIIVCFILICALIFLKIKQKEIALMGYTINTIFSALLIYSIFLTISQFTVQAKLDNLSYTRDLRNESVIINGKVENLTKFNIKKCYLMLNIFNKQHVSGDIFDDKNIRNAKMKNMSVSYTIEIINNLPGNTYKNFSASVPFPPSFNNVEFYHTFKCF